MKSSFKFLGRFETIAFLLIIAFSAVSASATNNYQPPKPPQAHAAATAAAGAVAALDARVTNQVNTDVTNAIRNTNELSNDQAQGQSQRQDQSQVAQGGSSTATNAGNSQTLNISGPSRIRLANVPDANAPPSFPTAPCRIAGSAGGSWVGGGISFGGSKQDPECDKRETARAFAGLGQNEAALLILCSTAAAKEALGEDCAKFKADPVPVAPAPVPAQVTVEVKTESEAARREREDRIFRRVLAK